MATDKLQIEINARDNASGVLRGVAGTAKTSFAGMAGAVKQYSGEIRAAGLAMAAMGAAVVAGAGKCIGLLRTQEVAQAKLTSAVKGTAQAIDQSRLEKLAADLQKVTTFGDEATIEMMAILTTFSLTQDQIESLAPRIQNISAMMGTDLVSSAVAVGKAISMGSATALQRYGVIINEATMKSGDFNGILKAIDANTGPAAEELAKGAGAAEQLKNTIGDLGESIGKALVPALKLANTTLTPVVELMGKMAETNAGKTLIVVGAAAGAAMIPLGAMLMMLPSIISGWELLTGAQIRNAAAARAAGAANAQAGAAAVAGGAGAAAGGAAAGGGGLLRGLGMGAGARAVGGAALRYAVPAWLAYEGAKFGLGRWQGKSEQQIAEIEGAGYTPLQEATMARWRAGRQGLVEREDEAAGFDPAQLAAPGPAAIAPELAPSAGAPIAVAPPARTVAGMTQLGPGAWALPGAAAEEVSVQSVRQVGPGRYELVIELRPTVPPGILDDNTTEYLEDLSYAGEGA